MLAALRPARRRLTVAAAGAAVLALAGAGVAVAVDDAAEEQPAIRTTTPTTADSITNIDVLRQQIRNYYGDPLSTGEVGPDSNYVREAQDVALAGGGWLALQQETPERAIVLDVDDTSLVTYNYEIASNWDFDPADNGEFVEEQDFPAVPGMVEMVEFAEKRGYAVFFLTGRPAAQEAATLGNLTDDGVGVDAGYPAPTALPDGEDGLFTKPAVADYPDYLVEACAGSPDGKCTTVQYKTATRAHIEAEGYDIVASFGDQNSDLDGGYSDRTFKLPNPSYYLP